MLYPTAANVAPLAMPSAQLRRRAAVYRRHRQPLTALELLRQAMERDDTTAVRLELAETLLALANYEQASELLYRTLSRPDAPPEAWMLLARAQDALGRTAAAADCLYHYLALDMYSDHADLARDMLASLEQDGDAHGPFRLDALVRRALLAWKAGSRDLAHKRMNRALRISTHPERQRLTLALLAMAETDYAAAYGHLIHALRRSPGHPRVLTALCVTLHAMGRKRAAAGMLEKCARSCQTPESEALFFSAAWTLGAKNALFRYLKERLRQAPCRAALLHPMAVLCSRSDPQQAARLWQRVLRITPADQRARFCLRRLESAPDHPVPPDASMPLPEIQGILRSLLGALSEPDALCVGSQSRMLADWFFTLPDERLQSLTLRMLSLTRGGELEAYLRELLTAPGVLPEIRQQVILRLHAMGVSEPLPMLTGQRMSMAQYAGDTLGKRRFSVFLALFLQETRQHGQSMPMAFYAAEVWRHMSPRQRAQATGERGYATVKAMELRYLLENHRECDAWRTLKRVQVSPRRVYRVLRRLARLDLPLKGDLPT